MWEWLVIVGIVVLLASILIPSLGHPRHASNQVKCSSNLRQIGQGLYLYAQDNGSAFPTDLAPTMTAYLIHPVVFLCPASSETQLDGPSIQANPAKLLQGHCSYIHVGRDLTTQSNPECVVAFEDPANHGMRGANVLYADGHVDWMLLHSFANFVFELQQGYNPPRQAMLASDAQARAMYDRDWKPKLAAMKSGQWAKALPPPRSDRSAATTAPTTQR